MTDPTLALRELAAMRAELVQTTQGYTQVAQPLVAGSHWANAMQHYEAVYAALAQEGIDFKLGDPAYGSGGWAFNGTSLGWSRQFPQGHPERCVFDPSVVLAKGYPTIACTLLPGDLGAGGDTGTARAQIFYSGKYPSGLPSMDQNSYSPATAYWWSFVFQTNPEYTPQKWVTFPDWNVISSWHNGAGSSGAAYGQAPIALQVAWKDENKGVWFQKPTLEVVVSGGPLTQPTGQYIIQHKYYAPDGYFVPGHKYLVEMWFYLGNGGNGGIEYHVTDLTAGTPPLTLIPAGTLVPLGFPNGYYSSNSVYLVHENYRPGVQDVQVQTTNTVYYMGIRRGTTRAEALVLGI